MTTEDRARKADDTFLEIFSDFDMLYYLNPINRQGERDKFFASWDDGEPYNPIFEYPDLPIQMPQWKQKLTELTFGTSVFEQALFHTREDLMLRLSVVEARDNAALTQLSRLIYGEPDEPLLNQAKATLKERRTAEKEIKEIGVKILKEHLRERLRSDRIDDWDVIEDPSTVGLAQVDWAHRKIRLQPGTIVSQKMLDRLTNHLIDIHVYRSVNGERQPYKVFAVGFDRYLEAEEGLAVYLEEKLELAPTAIRRRYAGRVLASHLTQTKSFFDIFDALMEFFPPDEAYTLAERSKRGFQDTSKPGGFVQDHIYLKGRNDVAKLAPEKLRHLYTGRIGIHHLPMVEEMIAADQLMEPAFLPNAIL